MPAPQAKIDLGNLEKRVNELQKNLAFVGQSTNADSSELFKIIHRPGWTTIAQVELATQLIDTMNQQAAAMRGLRNALDKHVSESTGHA